MKKNFLLILFLLFLLSCGGVEETDNDSDETEDIETGDTDTFDGSEVIKFKDVNLEKCVRTKIQKPEGEITVEDVKNVKTILCDEMGISTIDGIEKLINISYLSLTRNDIKDFSLLENLKSLKVLDIIENVNVDVKTLGGLNNLEELEASRCGLKELGVIINLVELKKLHVSSNQLKSIEEVKNLTGLIRLTVNANPLNSLKGIEGLKNLEGLSAGSNQLKSIEEVKNLTGLKTLFVDENYLKNDDLPVLLNLVNLEHLNIRENCITDFTVIDQMKENLPDAEILGGIIEAQDTTRCK